MIWGVYIVLYETNKYNSLSRYRPNKGGYRLQFSMPVKMQFKE